MDNIQHFAKLLRIIGTPFNPVERTGIDEEELPILYNIAKKNKIGLLFLESVKLSDKIELELEIQRRNQEIIRGTARRVADTLNKASCKYAIIKSIYQFAVTPNDVDVLVFEDNKQYRNIIEIMKNNDFTLMGRAPTEVMFHDASRGQHSINALAKDPFDADLYKEVGAGHIIYMNKKKLANQIREVEIDHTKVCTLEPSAELALSIFHSIYPERLFTLLLHYHALHTIKEMTELEMNQFLKICHEQKIGTAVYLVLNIMENLQEIAFGESPYKLKFLRERLGKRKLINIHAVPYNYSTAEILSSFWGKKTDMVFTFSFMKQLTFMINPKYARYVLGEFRHREKRDTY